MPKGKGTYGSQVGRPSENKTNEYFDGGIVTNDARDRMQNMIPDAVDTNVSMPMYKDGGSVTKKPEPMTYAEHKLKKEAIKDDYEKTTGKKYPDTAYQKMKNIDTEHNMKNVGTAMEKLIKDKFPKKIKALPTGKGLKKGK